MKIPILVEPVNNNGYRATCSPQLARVVDNPWVKYAGMFKDDPMFAEILEIMKGNRRKDDEDPEYL